MLVIRIIGATSMKKISSLLLTTRLNSCTSVIIFFCSGVIIISVSSRDSCCFDVELTKTESSSGRELEVSLGFTYLVKVKS